MNAVLAVSLIAIVVAIVLGYKFGWNTGIIAMGFAFLINVIMVPKGNVMGVINGWPTNVVFLILSISLFFTFATDNGTMDVLGKKILYALNGNAALIPWVITLATVIIGTLGAGISTPVIIGPVAFSMGLAAGIHPVVIAIAIGFGNSIGGACPWTGYGAVVSRGLIEKEGIEATAAMQAQMGIWFNETLRCLLMIAIVYVWYKAYKAKRVTVEKPGPFNAKQRQTITLVLFSFAAMLIPSVLNTFVTGNPTIRFLSTLLQPQSVFIFASIIAVVLKLGDEKSAFRKLPMSTVIMIAGVSMLLGVAKNAGLADFIAESMSSHVTPFLIPAVMLILASFLSFFSSSTSVVMPLMYTFVVSLAGETGMNYTLLFSTIFLGSLCTAMSPFSTGGSITIASCPDNAAKELLSKELIPWVVIFTLAGAVYVTTPLANIFKVAM
jgi:di/tricarboxylate transporter